MTERDADPANRPDPEVARPNTIEEDVSRLVRLAGRRPAVPEGVAERVYATVHAQWRRRLRAKRRRRLLMGAAAVLAGVTVLSIFRIGVHPETSSPAPAAPHPPVAVLEHVTGGGVWAAAGGALHALRLGADVNEATWLETRQGGRAALRTPGGTSIRIDTNTRVQMLSASTLVLDRGALYVDTGTDDRAPLEIRTPHGVVKHRGTQFEVQAAPDLTRVRVREGSVVLIRDGDRQEARAGTALAVRSEGVVRSAVPIYGPEWAWVEQSAPEFKLEGQSLEALLRWTARETGWTIRFASDRTARSVAGVRLHGSSTGLRPSETLEAVLPTCNLTLRLKDGTAWIEPLHGRGEVK
jgi:ferric-dicitrate binding protein FerR (iron transport regulator)